MAGELREQITELVDRYGSQLVNYGPVRTGMFWAEHFSREVERLSNENKTLRDQLTGTKDNQPLDVLDCGDNSCQFDGRGAGGVRTNGGCRCLYGLSSKQRHRVSLYLRRTVDAVRARQEKEAEDA